MLLAGEASPGRSRSPNPPRCGGRNRHATRPAEPATEGTAARLPDKDEVRWTYTNAYLDPRFLLTAAEAATLNEDIEKDNADTSFREP